MKPAAFSSRKPRQLLSTELHLWLAAASALAPFLLLAWLWWPGAEGAPLRHGLLVLAGLAWILLAAFWTRWLFVHRLRTLNTLVEAIRNEDYSLRGGNVQGGSAMAELFRQINALAGQLQHSRQDERELRGLLERIIARMDVAVLACDSRQRIILANPRAARLLALAPEDLRGLPLGRTGIDALLPAQASHVREHAFPGASGRWQIARQTFVQEGRQGSVIFITDLEQVLSEEEIRAWQRLIRVIAHEVNNSLTPITSLCQTLRALLPDGGETAGARMAEGLGLIHERAVNLRDFISDYARIARLPAAEKREFDLRELLENIRRMHANYPIRLHNPLEGVGVYGDRTQLEQALINLIKNASEANGHPALPIEITLEAGAGQCHILIRDHGAGIGNKANLFVPFYTTKEKGAGIGLALSRRIIMGHHGSISLDNRAEGRGAEVRITLPLAGPAGA